MEQQDDFYNCKKNAQNRIAQKKSVFLPFRRHLRMLRKSGKKKDF
jgi:hypothetical protein